MSRTLPRPTSGSERIDDSYMLIASLPPRAASRSRRLLLALRAPLAPRGEAVHARAVVEGLLRRGNVRRRAAPRVEGNRLQRAAVAERERPRRAHAVHRVEVRGG